MELNISKEDFKRIMLSTEEENDEEFIKCMNEDLADARRELVATLLEGGSIKELAQEADDGTDYFALWCFSKGIREFETLDEFVDTWYDFMRHVVDESEEGELTDVKESLEEMLEALNDIKAIENQLGDGL